MAKLIINGRVPSKKNSKQVVCFGNRPRVLPSKNYQEWHKTALQELKVVPIKTIETSELTLTFFAPDKRASDLSNKAESIMDLLVDAGVLKDDNWFIIPKLILIFGGVDKENPRCEIDYV